MLGPQGDAVGRRWEPRRNGAYRSVSGHWGMLSECEGASFSDLLCSDNPALQPGPCQRPKASDGQLTLLSSIKVIVVFVTWGYSHVQTTEETDSGREVLFCSQIHRRHHGWSRVLE